MWQVRFISNFVIATGAMGIVFMFLFATMSSVERNERDTTKRNYKAYGKFTNNPHIFSMRPIENAKYLGDHTSIEDRRGLGNLIFQVGEEEPFSCELPMVVEKEYLVIGQNYNLDFIEISVHPTEWEKYTGGRNNHIDRTFYNYGLQYKCDVYLPENMWIDMPNSALHKGKQRDSNGVLGKDMVARTVSEVFAANNYKKYNDRKTFPTINRNEYQFPKRFNNSLLTWEIDRFALRYEDIIDNRN